MYSGILNLYATTHIGVVGKVSIRIDIVAVHEESTETALTTCCRFVACIGKEFATLGILPVVAYVLGVYHLLGRTSVERHTTWTASVCLVDIPVGIVVCVCTW